MLSSKRLTISDIAKSAGVSKTTISRFLNGKYEYMSDETRDRIEMIIEMSGYRPNSQARSLKSCRSMLVGLVIADIESPFSAAIIKGAGDTLRQAGYSVIITNSDNNYEKEQECIHSLMTQRVDGLIVNTTTVDNPFLIDLANRGLPIVLNDRLVQHYEFDIVYVENEQAVHTALDHLADSGFGRVAFFTQPCEFVSPRFLRRNAFLDYLKQHGEANPQQAVFSIDAASIQGVVKALRQVMSLCKDDATPPAIFAANSVVLLQVIKAINHLGLRIPIDIGVCGYDDWGWSEGMDWTSLIGGGITTLSVSTHDLGSLTAQAFLNRLRDPDLPPQSVALAPTLIVRPSTQL